MGQVRKTRRRILGSGLAASEAQADNGLGRAFALPSPREKGGAVMGQIRQRNDARRADLFEADPGRPES